MATTYSYRDKWFISYFVKGVKKKINTKLKASKENFAKAQKMQREIEVNIEEPFKTSNSDSIPESVTRELTLEFMMEKFKEERMVGKSLTHQKNFRMAMTYFFKICGPQTLISKITSAEIAKVINLIKESVSNSSMHTYIRYIKILFNYLVDEDYIVKSPIKKKLIPKRDRNNIVIFEKEDLEKILNEAKIRDQKFYKCLMMLLLTGLRPTDLLELKVGSFNLAKKIINLRISKTQKEIKFPIYDELENFIETELKEELEKENSHLIFGEFTVETLGKRFSRIKNNSLLKLNLNPKFNLKTFRKTFATRMAERGIAIQDVSNLLGHDNIQTTSKYYTEVTTESVRKKINVLRKLSAQPKIAPTLPPFVPPPE